MGDKNTGWEDGTLKLVRAIWAMLIATIVIAGAMFFVLPHLTEGDGVLTRDEIGVVAGFVVVGGIFAFPNQVMQWIGALVKLVRAWRSK